MSGLNLSELVKGLMIVVAIAMSLGRLPELKQWAIKEAFGIRSQRTYKIQFHSTNPTSTKHQSK